MAFRTAFHMVISHQTRDLEYFEGGSNIPWNPPTNHCPDLIATGPKMSLLSLCALLFLRTHLFLFCVVLTYNDSRKDLHKTCQIPRNCQHKWLLVSSSAPGTSWGSSVSSGKFWFCTGGTVTTVLPSLVAPRQIDDCSAIHLLHLELSSMSATIMSPFQIPSRVWCIAEKFSW